MHSPLPIDDNKELAYGKYCPQVNRSDWLHSTFADEFSLPSTARSRNIVSQTGNPVSVGKKIWSRG